MWGWGVGGKTVTVERGGREGREGRGCERVSGKRERERGETRTPTLLSRAKTAAPDPLGTHH